MDPIIIFTSLFMGSIFIHAGMAVETVYFLPRSYLIFFIGNWTVDLIMALALFRLSLVDNLNFRDHYWFHSKRVQPLLLTISGVFHVIIFVLTVSDIYGDIAHTIGFKVFSMAYLLATAIFVFSAFWLSKMLYMRATSQVYSASPEVEVASTQNATDPPRPEAWV